MVDFFFWGFLFQVLDELQMDQWPVGPGNRASRCTGVALSVAAGLLGACAPGTGARIITLVGGPCTEGPGSVRSFEPAIVIWVVFGYKDWNLNIIQFHRVMNFV